jgi:hypothetical protein
MSAVSVVGTGAHSGATEQEKRTMRAAVAEADVKTRLSHVYAKLGVADRTELATVPPRIPAMKPR